MLITLPLLSMPPLIAATAMLAFHYFRHIAAALVDDAITLDTYFAAHCCHLYFIYFRH